MNRAIVLGAVAVAAGAAAGGWAFGYGPFGPHNRPAAAGGTVPVATATVRLGTITTSEENQGTVGYAGSFTVYSAVTGIVTWLPADGAVIRPGGRLFAVDGQEVLLMRGQTPAWRAFDPGMSDGPDVAELQRNLVALGCDPYHAITPGDHYDWATQAAIERWQAAQGWTPDGEIAPGQIMLGQVAFLPGPVRVAALAAGAGATVAAGTPVITATSTTAVVDLALPSAEQSAVTAGQRVTITLPDGATTTGRVLGAGPPTPASMGNGSGSSSGSGTSSGSGNTAGGQTTVGIVVALDRQAAVSGLDGSAVQVAIATQTQRDALITPISALLAGPGSGFQVTVVAGGTRRDVPVQTGLFDDIDGKVAISGPGIAAGTRVEVPQA